VTDAITHEEHGPRGEFFIMRDGKRIAELTYRRAGDSRVVIDHTEVEPALRGHGIARKLVDAAVAWARQSNTKLGATCPYVVTVFARDPSMGDVADRG
jgi:uncharacterized protein